MIKKLLIFGTVTLTLLMMFGFISKLFRAQSSEATTATESNVVLGMVLLNDAEKIDFKKILNDLKHTYNVNVSGQEIDEEKGLGVIQLQNSQIVIMLMGVPIPGDELEFPSRISYIWTDAKELTPKHKGHIIISVSSKANKKLNMFKTFTKAASAVLSNTNSLGIYLGSQTLVLPTSFYVEEAKSMTDEQLPLMNWIYFGLRVDGGKNSGYTFGLKEFGYDELEILNSKYPIEEIQGMLFNISHYVIQGDVTLKDGETIGLTADQKIKIVRSKGVQLEGTTLKLKY
jgi:hypothetical protein